MSELRRHIMMQGGGIKYPDAIRSTISGLTCHFNNLSYEGIAFSIECSVIFEQYDVWRWIFQLTPSTSIPWNHLGTRNSSEPYLYWVTNNALSALPFSLNTRLHIIVDKYGWLYINGIKSSDHSVGGVGVAGRHVALLNFVGSFEYLKLRRADNDKLMADFVPIVIDGVAGIIDRVSGDYVLNNNLNAVWY